MAPAERRTPRGPDHEGMSFMARHRILQGAEVGPYLPSALLCRTFVALSPVRGPNEAVWKLGVLVTEGLVDLLSGETLGPFQVGPY
jgi:hypothetical protein